MLYEYIFLLAILWTLTTNKLEVLLYLCVIALGIYIITNKYELALTLSVIVIGVLQGGFDVEHFTNEEDAKDATTAKPVIEIKDDKSDKENETTNNIPNTPEGTENFTSNDLEKSISNLEKSLGDDAHIDVGTNFLKAYESLNPEQIESMRKDTAELIETQKVLMKTLDTMSPILQNSHKMMNMFKGTFGEDFVKEAINFQKK